MRRDWMQRDHSPFEWKKSSYCGSGSCVEVAKGTETILLRDAKDSDSPVLAFTPSEWASFVAGVRAGEFD